MADTESTTDAQVAQVEPTGAEQVSATDDFDKERAMRTIQTLRAFEKEAKAKLKELDQLQAEKQQRDEADLTAAQKAEKRAADIEAKYKEAEARLHKATIKDAARAASDALNLPFAPGALEDAVALGVFNDLDVGDDGKVKGMHDALKTLQKARPYLFQTPRVPASDAAAKGTKQDAVAEKLQSNALRWGIRLPSGE